jgi:ferredoxin, 2Fe-2S
VGFLCGHRINGDCFTFNYLCESKNERHSEVFLIFIFISLAVDSDRVYVCVHVMIELIGRTGRKIVEPENKLSLLDLALKHKVDWGFSCTHGTCARCRCLVSKGMELLSEPNDAELDRLEPEEIDQGYRLACQTEVKATGDVVVKNVPYF